MGCICNSSELFNFGCICGAFKSQTENHIWFNGIVYSIAKDAEEAKKLAMEYLSEFQDFDTSWLEGELIGNGWVMVKDEEPLPLLIEEDSDVEETRLASEWVEHYGPGFLAAV